MSLYKNWRDQQLEKIHRLSSRVWKVCLAVSAVPVVIAVISADAGALLGTTVFHWLT